MEECVHSTMPKMLCCDLQYLSEPDMGCSMIYI